MSRIAGQRRDAALTVDYADVLRQAVANERYATLQDVRQELESAWAGMRTHDYNDRARHDEVRNVVRAALSRMERNR